MKRILFPYILFISFLLAQKDFVGDVFENGSVNFTDRTIQAIGIGFIPENVINAGQARRSAIRIAKQDALRQLGGRRHLHAELAARRELVLQRRRAASAWQQQTPSARHPGRGV